MNRIKLVTALETQKCNIQVSAEWVSQRGCLVSSLGTGHCTWQRGEAVLITEMCTSHRENTVPSLTTRAEPSRPHHLLKAPPSKTIPQGLVFQKKQWEDKQETLEEDIVYCCSSLILD